MMTSDMRITVVVPTYNEEKMIGRCLRAIRAQRFRDYELIVVDGHSTDRTVKIARRYADKVYLCRGFGPASARNAGARKAKGEIVAFIDADTIANNNWLDTIWRNFTSDKYLIGVSGRVLQLDGTWVDHVWEELSSTLSPVVAKIVPFFMGNNCAFLKRPFLKVGGFREDLYMIEDFELSLRMAKFGKMKIDKSSVVKTSMRRYRQKGYIGPLIRYVAALIGLFFGFKIGKNYFREIKK